MNVSGRDYILIHPANEALRELKGCIAPVSFLTGAGKGIRSRMALKTLTGLVYGALDRHEQVFITIKSKILMNLLERAVSPTPTFFQKLRNIGLALAAISAAIIAAPVALPAIVATIAGYLAVAGTVLSGVSQVTTTGD